MKYVLFISLFVTALNVAACHKDKQTAILPDLSGVYNGIANSKSRALKEVFTSPNASHYEWVTDSVFNKPDTLVVTNISVDSFTISGSLAQSLPPEWRTFGTQESAGPSEFTFERHISLSGYFYRNLVLTFDPTRQTISVDYSTENTQSPSSFDLQFSGAQ